MVKIFVGNLTSSTTAEELRQMFEEHGKVTECDLVKNFAFVHMANLSEAEEAVKNLHQQNVNGCVIKVEMSRGKSKASTKLHVSSLGETVTREMLRAKFEEFGPVVECDLVKDYAFIHMSRVEDAMEAVNKMANKMFEGKVMNVQLSTSQLRTTPGMGDHKGCFVCGQLNHWSNDCPKFRDGSHPVRGRGGGYGPRHASFRDDGDGYSRATPPDDYRAGYAYSRSSYSNRIPPPPPPPPSPRWMSSYSLDPGSRYDSRATSPREESSSAYFYERSKVQSPYSSAYHHQGNGYPIPQPPPTIQSRLSFSADPYAHRQLPPHSTAATAYYAGQQTTINRAPTSSTDYSYERQRLSPPSSTSRSSSYDYTQSNSHYAPRYAPY